MKKMMMVLAGRRKVRDSFDVCEWNV